MKSDSSLGVAWYRFRGAAGIALPESCPPLDRCNAHYPGWLNGNHPTVADGEVTRTVCYHYGDICCNWTNTIKVRNCGDFYVYELQPSPSSYLRYCGTHVGKSCSIHCRVARFSVVDPKLSTRTYT